MSSILKHKMLDYGISARKLSEEMGISYNQMRYKLKHIEYLKYNEIKFLLNKFNLEFEELEK